MVYRKKAKMMPWLPNEILLDVLRWLDRRTLELCVRLASRRADALVRSLPGGWPLLSMRELNLLYNNKSVLVELRQRNRIITELEPPKPFMRFDLKETPKYLVFEQTTLKKFEPQSARIDTKNWFGLCFYTRNITRKRNKVLFDDVDDVGFQVFSDSSADLYNFAWGESFRFDLELSDTQLSSKFGRTCTQLIGDDIPPDVIHPMVRWLTTPVEPSHWNPEPAHCVKHQFIFYGRTSTFTDAIIKNFQSSVSPSCSYHITIAVRTFDVQSSSSRWHNPTTRQTLHALRRGMFYMLWCQPDDSPKDIGHDCEYFQTIETYDVLFR